jgi:hypothetical protein
MSPCSVYEALISIISFANFDIVFEGAYSAALVFEAMYAMRWAAVRCQHYVK